MIVLLSALLAVGSAVQPPAGAPAQPVPFVLIVKGGVHGTAEIRTKQVETKAILERLQRELKVPLVASKIVAQHRVDLSMKEITVVGLLLALAPSVVADIEVGADPEDAIWKAIHLTGYNEKEPAPELKQVGFLVAAGTINNDGSISLPDPNAEDKLSATAVQEEPKDSDKAMLAVVVTDGRVSVRSRKQPLVALLNEVAKGA